MSKNVVSKEHCRTYIGSLARSVFSDDSDDSELTDEFWSKYNSLIENEEYSEAEAFVRKFYNSNKLDKDIIFYFTTAQSLHNQALTLYADDSFKLAQRAKKNVDIAIGMCEVGTDDYDELRKLRKSIEEAISGAQCEIRQSDAWKATSEAFDNLCGEGNYDKAESILMDYYQEFENGELDCYYWRCMAELHYWKHSTAENSQDAGKEYQLFLQNLDKASTMTNNADFIKQLSEMRKWEKYSGIVENDSVKDSPQSGITNSEKDYMNEIRTCLSDDGIITDRERRLFDRLRRTLGISEQRAAELEAMCNPKHLTQEEQEYADEFKACFEDDGEITARERRLLDRLRISLGITESRATEIEKNITV